MKEVQSLPPPDPRTGLLRQLGEDQAGFVLNNGPSMSFRRSLCYILDTEGSKPGRATPRSS